MRARPSPVAVARGLVVFLTLDGVYQAPGGPEEDPSGGFEHGGWQMPFFDDEGGEFVGKGIDEAGAFLLGRVTYDIFAGFWPNQPTDDAFGGPMNANPKYVVSTTLPAEQTWQPTTVLRGIDAVRRLKVEDGGDILLFGSGELMQSLMGENLVDEYRLLLYPLILGAGKRLFRSYLDMSQLELIDSQTTSKGVLLVRYWPV
jgi:dihydrofolate reductase